MKNHSFNSRLSKLVYTAVFAAISIALNTLEINLVSFKVTFTYIPIFLSGAFLGPLAGLLTGAIGDVVGFLIYPTGSLYNPFFTISSALIGVFAGVVFKYTTFKEPFKIWIGYFLVFIVCTLAINTTTIYYLYFATKKAFAAYLISRVSTQGAVIIFNMILTYSVLAPLKNILRFKKFSRA
ncbi:MAG: folate family ECF transporter S component [Christensenellaceae bacterium]|jgi:ECF transporter S component (folate family)|nr:folate family ECF transporter S component [Christensenellaceae bacterium]